MRSILILTKSPHLHPHFLNFKMSTISSSTPSTRSSLISADAISALVQSALAEFLSVVEAKYEVKSSEDMWVARKTVTPTPGKSGQKCNAILQSGPNKGKECGKACTSGKPMCSTHAKKAGVVTPVKTSTPTVDMNVVFHKSTFGNFVFEGFVFDKVKKGICGKEISNGSIVPLTPEDVIRVRALRLTIVSTESVVVPEPVAEVEETVEERVEEDIESVEEAEEVEDVEEISL